MPHPLLVLLTLFLALTLVLTWVGRLVRLCRIAHI